LDITTVKCWTGKSQRKERMIHTFALTQNSKSKNRVLRISRIKQEVLSLIWLRWA
jgi:hypothetical protein